MHTENQKASAYTAACSKERWSVEDLQYTSEGSLAWACFNAGYDLASAALATPEAGGAGEGEALKLVLTRAAELIANESPTTQGGTSLAPSDRFHALLLALNPYLYNPFEGPAYVIDPAKIPALSATPVGGDVVGEPSEIKKLVTQRLDEFFDGKPGYRRVVDHYLFSLEHQIKVLSGLTGYTYPGPIPFPASQPKEEMEHYYVTSDQRPEPHLLMWGDGDNDPEWCGWDGDNYEPSKENVTGFWPKPRLAAPTPTSQDHA